MRKINRIKKIVAFFLTMILIINVQCTNATAADKTENQIVSYVESILPQYLTVNELLADKYNVSLPITLYNWETGESTKTLFFVFEGNKVVGQLVVQYYEGEYYSSFTTSCADVLTKVYQEKTPVAFGSYNGYFVMCTETEEIVLAGENKNNLLEGFSNNLQARTYVLKRLEKIAVDYSIEITPAVITRTTVYNKQLNVKTVVNPPINGGICWAACAAAKINYQKGIKISARDIYDELDAQDDDTPVGSGMWIGRAYELYDLDITRVNSALTASTCLAQLNNNKPLELDISRNGGGHAVLLIGVYYTDVSTAGGVYTLMDPNVFGAVTVGVQPSVIQNGSNFVYATTYGNNYTYTSWFRTWY